MDYTLQFLGTLMLVFLFCGLLIRAAFEVGRARITYRPTKEKNRPLRLYLSGAMASDPHHPQHFLDTALALRSEGFIVMSPGCLPDGFDYPDYLHIDFAMIDVCDAVYMMHNWRDSPGACAELLYAEDTGKKIIYGRHEKPHVVLDV